MKLKLGIVLGTLVILAACQKEEVTVTGVATERSINKMYQEAPVDQGPNVFTPNPTDDNDKPPVTTTSQTPYDYVELSDDNDGFSPEKWPSNDATDIGINSDKTAFAIDITWTDKAPTDEKWVFIAAKDVPRDQMADSNGSACLFEACDTAIPAAQAYYQHLANQYCKDMYVCVTCCQGEHILYARMIIEHNCGIMPPPEDF